MPHKRYLLTLTADEREYLAGLLSAGRRSALMLARARGRRRATCSAMPDR